MRKTKFIEGEYYHIYNRGVEKRTIYTSVAEYQRFLGYLYFLNDSKSQRLEHILKTKQIWEAEPPKSRLVAIGAYCLMPNHFHLYVTPLMEGGVSKFMQRVQTAYTMFFNTRHQRYGVLFQGAFKAEHVATEVYAKYLFSYIHLNPMKLKNAHWKEVGADLDSLKDYAFKYPYSSLREYTECEYFLTQPQYFPAYLNTQGDIYEHICDWLQLGGSASQL